MVWSTYELTYPEEKCWANKYYAPMALESNSQWRGGSRFMNELVAKNRNYFPVPNQLIVGRDWDISPIMKRFTGTIIIFLLTLAFAGCEYSRLALNGSPDTQYHRTLQSLTHHQRLYGLDKDLYETSITYVNEALAHEYVTEYAKIFSLTDEKKATMMQEKHNDEAKYDDFMVAHYASESDNQKLNTKDPEKMVWKFFLRTNQSDATTLIEPLEISPVKLGTQKSYFYPHLNGWNELYRVRFPKTQSASKTIIMKGPIRELTFVWK
jgi:hypothetical protein